MKLQSCFKVRAIGYCYAWIEIKARDMATANIISVDPLRQKFMLLLDDGEHIPGGRPDQPLVAEVKAGAGSPFGCEGR